MSELERLKADLEVLERYHVSPDITRHVKESIVRAEDAADPWREAKRVVERYRGSEFETGKIAAFCDHLTAENARLEKENRALGRKIEIDGRLIANLEQENLDWLDEIRDRAKERDESLARVAELEAAAKAETEL